MVIPFALSSSRAAHGAEARVEAAAAELTHIVVFCLVIYALVGLLWLLQWQWAAHRSKELEQRFVMVRICTFWGATSIGTVLLNKCLITRLHAPGFVSMVQMLLAVAFLLPFAWRKCATSNRYQLRLWLLVPVFFAAQLATSAYSMQYISLSLLTVIQNLTPLVVLPIERAVMPLEKQPHASNVAVLAILIMVAGACVYGGGLKDISASGIILALANKVVNVAECLVRRRLLTEECKDLHTQGLGICYAGFEIQRLLSATSFLVLHNIAKVAVIVSGIAFFEDPFRSRLVITGLSLNLLGSFMYGATQIRETDDLAKEQQPLRGKAKDAA